METQAPPPYSGTQPSQAYRIYWGFLFGTLLTWVFAVAATLDGGWVSETGVSFVSLNGSGVNCPVASDSDFAAACSIFKGAQAFQYMAAFLVSFSLILIAVAAFLPAPATGKFGFVAGIALAVYSVVQLIAFSLMAAYVQKYKEFKTPDFDDDYYNDYYSVDITPGPAFAVAVVACSFGLVGAIVTLVFLQRATTDQDGPLRKFVSGANAGGANTAAAGPPAVGTV